MKQIDKMLYEAQKAAEGRYQILLTFADGEQRTVDVVTAVELALGNNPLYPAIVKVQPNGKSKNSGRFHEILEAIAGIGD